MVTVKTRLGSVQGVDRGKLQSFLGLPYAAPPTGDRRWKPPSPPAPWSGVYDATRYPNRSLQAPFPEALMPPGGIPGATSEDMLYLNVHTPKADKRRRPVMVWIHGGGYTLGSANDFDPVAFVSQHDVVVVAINYRLGIFGFLDLSRFGPEYTGSASLGFQDQIAAIRWVAENVADYGGDPGNITICGGSAGAGSVVTLLAAPSAKGLFHKAIAVSPLEVNPAPLDIVSPCAAALKMDEQAFFTHIKSMSGEELFKFQTDAGIGTSACVDGHVIAKRTSEAIKERINPVPLLVGCTLAEGPMLTEGVILNLGNDPAVFAMLEAGMSPNIGGGDATRYKAFLDKATAGGSLEDRLNRVWFDCFRSYVLRTAQAMTDAGFDAWAYTFAVPTEHPHGPTHGSDVPFVFNSLDPKKDGELNYFYRNEARTRGIAEMWSKTMVHFMRSGNPNRWGMPKWPTYTATRRACLVLQDRPAIVKDPDGPEALSAYGLT
jgi:para-nitrobenzyl esterase